MHKCLEFNLVLFYHEIIVYILVYSNTHFYCCWIQTAPLIIDKESLPVFVLFIYFMCSFHWKKFSQVFVFQCTSRPCLFKNSIVQVWYLYFLGCLWAILFLPCFAVTTNFIIDSCKYFSLWLQLTPNVLQCNVLWRH